MSEAKFGYVDYVVFGLLLLVSALIGVYHACSGGKQKTEKEWLAGDQELAWLPTSLSLLASFISAITLLGTPSVLYTEGSMYLYVSAAYLVVMPVTALIFMPVFRRVNSLSAFIYLERRFGKFIALVSCVIYLFHMTIYMGIVLYAPALALSAVTGLSLEGSIITVSVVCLFYTVIGGMKAIIWTDALQTIVMTVGMIVVCIVGTIKLGGLSVVYEISNQGNHLIYDEFSLDPRRRHAGFDCIVGGLFTWLTIYSANQAQVQRYISIGRKVDAQKAIFLNLPGLVFLMFVSGYGGLLAYTKYALCDPIQKGDIFKADQILPFFVIDTFGDWYGFSGLFVSSIFSGSLSTISSGVNALAAVVLTNMIPPHKLSETTRAKLGKGMAVGFGLAALGFAFLCKYLEAILPLALALNGILAGPMLGIFVLGMLSRRSTNIGATVGYFVGLALQVFIYYGSQIEEYSGEKINLFTTNCTATLGPDAKLEQLKLNQDIYGAYTPATDNSNFSFLSNTLFRLSYLWYSLIGVTVVYGVGYLVSVIDHLVSKDPKEVDEDLLFHWEDIKSEDFKPNQYNLELKQKESNAQ